MRAILLCLLFILPATVFCQNAPFAKGVNLTNWFQVGNAKQIQFTKYTKQDFENIQGLGCDVIRLPINLHFMTDGAPAYVLDPLFLSFLDEAVNWAEELACTLFLIITPLIPRTTPTLISVKFWKKYGYKWLLTSRTDLS